MRASRSSAMVRCATSFIRRRPHSDSTVTSGFAFLPFTAPSARQLRATDVYVLSSAWEAFSIGVLEALACGVPQVATDVGGTREVVDDETGILVPPHDPSALAEALVALLSDPERRARLATASQARHSERFGLDRMVAATASLYDEISQ